MTWQKRDDPPEYKKMRAQVRKRDKNKCQLCGSKKRFSLQVHHIQRFSDNIAGRYDPDNGILLCKDCHKMVTGREHFYAPLFCEIIAHNKKK